MTTGEALATLRCRAGLTKTEVGRACGVNVHVIAALERDLILWNPELGSRLLTVLAAPEDLAIATLISAQQRTDIGDPVQGIPVVLH